MEKAQTNISENCTEELFGYLIQLIRSSLNGEPVPEKPETVSWIQLFQESKRQSVLLLAYDSIKKLENGPDGEIGEKWQQWNNKLLTKGVNQTIAIEELLRAFNAAQIRLLPMKGYYIRKTYPTQECREMTDLDVLIDADAAERATALLRSWGYTITEDHEVHTSLSKPPYLCVELHKKLLPDYVGHGDYYADVWNRAQPEADSPYICHLSPSDTLIHIFLHFYKHYAKRSSCGIRFAIDFFTYSRYYQEQLDWVHIWNELEQLGIRQTAEDVLGLGQAWFGDSEMTERQAKMGKMMCSSGTFGTKKGYDYNQIMHLTPKSGNIKVGKLRYFLRIVFPPLDEMRLSYPCLKKAPILLPFTWLIRGFRIMFTRPDHIKRYYTRMNDAVPNKEK